MEEIQREFLRFLSILAARCSRRYFANLGDDELVSQFAILSVETDEDISENCPQHRIRAFVAISWTYFFLCVRAKKK